MRAKLPGLPPEGERSVLAALESLERRLARVEPANLAPEVGILSSDFRALEGQTLIVSAPTAGVTGLLPRPRPQNRFARIHLIFTGNNPVTLICDGGTVNGSTALVHDVLGAYTAICDGLSGWWLQSLELGAHLRGIGLTVNSDGTLSPRQRPRNAQIRDYFLSGNAASGSIGSLGWNLLGSGTPAYARANAGVMGSSNRGTLSTSAATNDRSCLTLGETETRDIVPASEVQILQCSWNHDASLANKRIFFGLLGTFANDPAGAVDCLGVYYDSAVNANYQIIARSSSSGSPTVSATAVPSNTAELMTIFQHSPGSYRFYSGGTLLGTISSGVPTAAMNVGFRVETLTTVVKTVNLGYFGLEATATNSYDDDAFLEA